MSTLERLPAVKGPDEPVLVDAKGGALTYVIVVSPQLVSATPQAVNGFDVVVFDWMLSEALRTVPTTPDRSNYW
ncbi:MAG TPA: hypothetical protein VE640_04235 [Candidatus Bathyarchaeia archaeon]|nr:hypothetical protein [Candidatus Bathyarchaeia archaeon]